MLFFSIKEFYISSYLEGNVEVIADNHIQRNFEASDSNEKWFITLTEFNVQIGIFHRNQC
jgi:hypothetical protein